MHPFVLTIMNNFIGILQFVPYINVTADGTPVNLNECLKKV